MKIDARLYYATPNSRPILVEVLHEFVAEVGEPDWRPLSSYKGHFVPLVEAPQQLPTGIPATVAPAGGQA